MGREPKVSTDPFAIVIKKNYFEANAGTGNLWAGGISVGLANERGRKFLAHQRFRLHRVRNLLQEKHLIEPSQVHDG
jgi:hypothetical protein